MAGLVPADRKPAIKEKFNAKTAYAQAETVKAPIAIESIRHVATAASSIRRKVLHQRNGSQPKPAMLLYWTCRMVVR